MGYGTFDAIQYRLVTPFKGRLIIFWVRGGGRTQGGELNRTTSEGGRKILDASRRECKRFLTSPEGGAKNFRFDQFFFQCS